MKKILVLDDNLDILQLVENVLVYEKFRVISLTEAPDFIETALRYMPDLFLIDYLLSGSTGADLCKQIKSHSKLKHIPVIIFSAYLHDNVDLQTLGCDSFIAKPFDLDVLIEKVNGLLSGNLV